MAFDKTAFYVLLIILLGVCFWVFVMWRNTREFHKQIKQVAEQQSIIRHDKKAKILCRAIHFLHPSLHAGNDYVISNKGTDHKPVITEWNTHIPQPTQEELDQTIAKLSGIDPERDHARLRKAEYPTVGDQLDAAYKARHGDPSEQARLDERIGQIKEKYPKSDQDL